MISFKKLIAYIFAEGEDFALEHRLFLSSTIIGTLTSVVGGVINILLGASLPSIIVPFLISVFLLILYYFLRIKRIFEPFIFPTIFISYIGISIIWISNGGLNGVNIMPAFVILILGLIIAPENKKKNVIAFFITLFIINYLVEYFHPELIVTYPSESSLWVDSLVTFLYSSFFIFLIIKFIHKNYTLERHKSEESEEKYRMLTESMKDVVWTLDADTLHYTYISPSVQKLRGYTSEEVLSNPFDAAFTVEEMIRLNVLMKQRIEALMANKNTKPNYYTDELIHLCKDGTTVCTEVVHEYYINKKNNRVEIRGVTRDITERKKAEQQIRIKNQELSNLNAEKDKFFSIIAHDLKSPFISIIGLSDFLVKKVNEKDLDQIERYAENIKQSSHRVMDLLSNLMLWSYSQIGRMRFKPEYFDLANLVDEVLLLFKESTNQKCVNITTEFPEVNLVYADKAMIGTILRNLISNAIKFSYPGGIISISVTLVEYGLQVKVCDSGIGIPSESISKLFRIDENFTTPGTQSEQGTGLGLILCKEFVEKHRGKIWVESGEEKGSTFYFTIPGNPTL
jgi:PAS domain S-box-containing protein